LVTVTFTSPSASPVEAGVVAFRVVPLTKVTAVALFDPNATLAPLKKFVPVIVIEVPPAGVATTGEIFVIVGAGYLYSKPFVNVALKASGFVTVTFTAPSASPVEAGVVAFRLVALTTVTAVALFDPKLTVAPLTKLVPVIVITVPPLGVAVTGEIFVTVGAVCAGAAGHRRNIGASAAIRRTARRIDVEKGWGFCSFSRFIQLLFL
jgi:hypothetical protein